MSFNYNPLKHIEIVDDPPSEGYSTSMDPDTYALYCHSCGNSAHRVSKKLTIEQAFLAVQDHIYRSHASRVEHFKNWSVY